MRLAMSHGVNGSESPATTCRTFQRSHGQVELAKEPAEPGVDQRGGHERVHHQLDGRRVGLGVLLGIARSR
jgi:hypothetical protein